ncbi:MAG TPA: hypothetical protein VMS64_08715 [Candidatus Methylomirabilis sp.]|nr:hypothetical protein [Candidatus Methylomirabilis sp.]
MRAKVWLSLAASAVLVLGPAWPVWAQAGPGPSTVMDGQWHFMVAPYIWFAGINGDISVKGIADVPIDESFSDVFSNLHFGFLGHFEGRKDRWGFATDIMYMDVHVPVAEGAPVLGQLGLDTTVKFSTVEGDAFYRVAVGGRKDNPPGLDILVGARYYGTSTQLNATLPTVGGVTSGKQTFSWVDGLIGLRFRTPLGSRVAFIGRGDIAGFGSKFTWNLEGDLAARLSEHWTAGAGWRHMSIDYDKAGTDRQLFNLAYDGPRAWFAYAW